MRPSILLLVASSVLAQDQAPPGENTEAARAIEAAAVAKKAAETYRVTSGQDGGEALRLEPVPLLQWSNPAGGSYHGSVFVWTSKGKPEVVASIYKKYLPLPHHLGLEFHSLTAERVKAEGNGHVDWTPSRAGVEFSKIEGAPAPADTPARRLRQMRALASEFSATKTDRQANTRPLRLLTQPIYRYEGTDPGALFAFVEGTDPEVFLRIESRDGQGGPAWHYALARMNSVEFRVTRGGREVWSVPILPWTQAKDPLEPYTLITFRPGEGVNPPEAPSGR